MTAPAVNHRAAALAQTKRIVVKVGTRLLRGEDARIPALIDQIAVLREHFEVILVSSGAIAAGMDDLALRKRPRDLPRLQALAAVGQSTLMSRYTTACEARGFHAAQILLSRDDLRDRRRHLNMCNCLYALLARGILPVINENDTVSIDEIRFGDNDILAAMVATMIRADLTVLLTTVDGLQGRDGNRLTERLPVVTEVTDELRGLAGDTDDSQTSQGGMAAKLRAAELCMAAGEYLWICDGRDFSVLDDVVCARDVGTLFVPAANRLAKSKRWVAFFSEPAGSVTIDDGAVRALSELGKSLLARGVTAVSGIFEPGDTVSICTPAGSAIGMGISNYSAHDLARIKGEHTAAFLDILGEHVYDEVIHRDNLVVRDGAVTPPLP
jgi:glutamate 5-kinase